MKIQELGRSLRRLWHVYISTNINQSIALLSQKLALRISILVVLSVVLVAVVFFKIVPAVVVADYQKQEGYIVMVDYDGETIELQTDAFDVAGVLEELEIKTTSLDIITPSKTTKIDQDNLLISVKTGELVLVIDGEQSLTHVATEKTPEEIIRQVGYQLGHKDQVQWGQYYFNNNQLLTVRSIQIVRSNSYYINIDGEVDWQSAQASQVKDILEELDYSTEDIAYISSPLDAELNNGDYLTVYYKQSGQKIVKEFERHNQDQASLAKETVYMVTLNGYGQEIKRSLIDERILNYTDVANPNSSTATASLHQPPVSDDNSTSNNTGLNQQKQAWLQAAGIAETDWQYVDYIISKESNWRYNIWNIQGSGAYGLCQTMLSVHEVDRTFMIDPVAQLRWCAEYAETRYGSWQEAYNAWLEQNWW